MSRRESFPGKSHFTTSVKAVSIVLTAGFIALLMSRTPAHLTEESLLPAPAVVEQLAGPSGIPGLTGAPGWTLSAEQYESAARVARQDDPPIPSF